MKGEIKLWIVVFFSFLVLEVAGLMLGIRLVNANLVQPETGVGAGLTFFVYLLVATGILLIVIRFFRSFLKVLEILAIFIASEAFFEIIFIDTPAPAIPGLILALLVVYLRLVFPDDITTQNIAVTTSVLGIGAILGASLGLIASWALMFLLAIYDFVAVFKTRHMVYMAKEIIKQKLAFTLAIPTRTRMMQLGGGDLAMPIVVSTAIYRGCGFGSAILSLAFGLVGLIALMAWLARRPGMAMPALPPIAVGMFFGFVISFVPTWI